MRSAVMAHHDLSMTAVKCIDNYRVLRQALCDFLLLSRCCSWQRDWLFAVYKLVTLCMQLKCISKKHSTADTLIQVG